MDIDALQNIASLVMPAFRSKVSPKVLPPPLPASIGLGPLPTTNTGLAERNLTLATVVIGLI